MDFDDLFSSISEQTETNEESNADPSSAAFTFKNELLTRNPFHVAGINIATLQELGAKEGFELPAAVVDLLKTSLRFTVLRSHPDVFNTSDSSATEVGDFLKALNTLHKPEEMKAALTDYLQDSHIDPQLAAFYREATADLERYERQKARSAIATLEHFDFMTQLQRDGARPYQVIPANVQSPIFSKTLKKFGKILDRRENHIMNSQDQDVVDLDRLAGQVFPQVITELLAVPASPIPVTKKGTYVSNNPKLLDACWKAVARLEETLERSFLTKARDKDIAADLIVRQALATTTQALDTVHERLAHSYFRPLAMLFKTATYKTEPAIADLELLLLMSEENYSRVIGSLAKKLGNNDTHNSKALQNHRNLLALQFGLLVNYEEIHNLLETSGLKAMLSTPTQFHGTIINSTPTDLTIFRGFDNSFLGYIQAEEARVQKKALKLEELDLAQDQATLINEVKERTDIEMRSALFKQARKLVTPIEIAPVDGQACLVDKHGEVIGTYVGYILFELNADLSSEYDALIPPPIPLAELPYQSATNIKFGAPKLDFIGEDGNSGGILLVGLYGIAPSNPSQVRVLAVVYGGDEHEKNLLQESTV